MYQYKAIKPEVEYETDQKKRGKEEKNRPWYDVMITDRVVYEKYPQTTSL